MQQSPKKKGKMHFHVFHFVARCPILKISEFDSARLPYEITDFAQVVVDDFR